MRVTRRWKRAPAASQVRSQAGQTPSARRASTAPATSIVGHRRGGMRLCCGRRNRSRQGKDIKIGDQADKLAAQTLKRIYHGELER